MWHRSPRFWKTQEELSFPIDGGVAWMWISPDGPWFSSLRIYVYDGRSKQRRSAISQWIQTFTTSSSGGDAATGVLIVYAEIVLVGSLDMVEKARFRGRAVQWSTASC